MSKTDSYDSIGDAARALSASLQSAMSALYLLETSLSGLRGSSNSTEAVKKMRKTLREEWESLLHFVQDCYAFGSDVSTLDISLKNGTAADRKELLISMSQKSATMVDRSDRIIKEVKVTFEGVEPALKQIAQDLSPRNRKPFKMLIQKSQNGKGAAKHDPSTMRSLPEPSKLHEGGERTALAPIVTVDAELEDGDSKTALALREENALHDAIQAINGLLQTTNPSTNVSSQVASDADSELRDNVSALTGPASPVSTTTQDFVVDMGVVGAHGSRPVYPSYASSVGPAMPGAFPKSPITRTGDRNLVEPKKGLTSRVKSGYHRIKNRKSGNQPSDTESIASSATTPHVNLSSHPTTPAPHTRVILPSKAATESAPGVQDAIILSHGASTEPAANTAHHGAPELTHSEGQKTRQDDIEDDHRSVQTEITPSGLSQVSLEETKTALSSIKSNLDKMRSFWQTVAAKCQSLTADGAAPLGASEAEHLVSLWRRNEEGLLAAATSIAKVNDAMAIDAASTSVPIRKRLFRGRLGKAGQADAQEATIDSHSDRRERSKRTRNSTKANTKNIAKLVETTNAGAAIPFPKEIKATGA